MSRTDDAPRALVDLHCHPLPGIDDGPADAAGSLALLQRSVSDGIAVIVATPHAERTNPEQIACEVQRLNQLVHEWKLPLTIVPGSEVRLGPDTPGQFAAGSLVPINGSAYLLIELPLNAPWPPNLQAVISALRMAGASPILAHAERYPTIQHHPELVADLVANEVLIQLNASSLLRSGSGRRRKTAEYLLRSRLAHLVASDAHDATVRPPLLTPALARAAELVGDDYVAWMAQTAADVVAGQPVIMPRPELDDGRERAWSRWWRRATGR